MYLVWWEIMPKQLLTGSGFVTNGELAVVFLFVGAVVQGAVAGGPERYQSPQDVTQLWAGFDPAGSPPDVEIQKTWVEGAVRFQSFYFTSEVWEGEPAKVFAYLGVPTDQGKVPGVLHLHGGGQTASLEWIRFWTSRGYAAISIDWLGKWPGRTDYARWGKVKGDMAEYGNSRITTPSVRHCAWYHWTVAARRALTLLAGTENVDDSRLGVFGVSMGASLTWMVAGTDERIRTAVPIYGCGWNTYPDVHSGMGFQHPVPPDIELWRATVESETYARYVTCPMLLLSATNDFHANMDRAYDSLARVRAEVRQAFTPRYSHHLRPAEGRNLPLWMESQLKAGEPWPTTPRLVCAVEKGELLAGVACDRPGDVEVVSVFSAAGQRRPQARFWRAIASSRDNDGWQAVVPVVETGTPMRLFCNVTYKRGLTLTSAVVEISPAALGMSGPTGAPDPVIDDFRGGTADWTYNFAYTDAYLELDYLLQAVSADGSPSLTLNPAAWGGDQVTYTFGTHKISDPAWRAPRDARLAFQYRAATPTRLEIHAWVDHWGPHQKHFTAELKPEASAEYAQVTVQARDLKTSDGAVLDQWADVDRLEFSGEAPRQGLPQFGRVEWR